jgi:hypothetical protein
MLAKKKKNCKQSVKKNEIHKIEVLLESGSFDQAQLYQQLFDTLYNVPLQASCRVADSPWLPFPRGLAPLL